MSFRFERRATRRARAVSSLFLPRDKKPLAPSFSLSAAASAVSRVTSVPGGGLLLRRCDGGLARRASFVG